MFTHELGKDLMENELDVAFKKLRTTSLLFLLADMAECAMKEAEQGGKAYACELPREAVEKELKRTIDHLNGMR